MDVRLHGETQLAILREMKAIRPWIKSIIITAYPQEETVLEAKKIGIVDYVVKPIDLDDLQRIIHGTIESIYKDNINAINIESSVESSTEDLIPGIKIVCYFKGQPGFNGRKPAERNRGCRS